LPSGTSSIPLCLVRPDGASAQGLRFTPWLGMYAPTRDIGAVQAVDCGKRHASLALGADLDVGGASFLGLRAGAGFATEGDIECAICGARSNVFTMTGGLVGELDDHMSRFDFGDDSNVQHDLFLKFGLSFMMGGGGDYGANSH